MTAGGGEEEEGKKKDRGRPDMSGPLPCHRKPPSKPARGQNERYR
jgi:hypothetical protein